MRHLWARKILSGALYSLAFYVSKALHELEKTFTGSEMPALVASASKAGADRGKKTNQLDEVAVECVELRLVVLNEG